MRRKLDSGILPEQKTQSDTTASTCMSCERLLIKQLRAESLHTRYGAVMALRKIGPKIAAPLIPMIMSRRERDHARLGALEAIRPFWCLLRTKDLVAFSSILKETYPRNA